jgi:drug/metabolite transporter (DMT)-like permease
MAKVAAVSATVIALVLASALLHAAWSASIKGSASPLAFNLVQTVVTVPFAALGLLAFDLGDVPPLAWACAVGTGVSHGLYLLWLSHALERADLTLAYPIVRSTPALLPLLAVPFLGEVPSPLGALGIAVVVSGIWLVHGSGLRLHTLVSPALRYAWLTLLATVGYSLSDKAAMAALDGGRWSGPLPAALAWFCVLSLAGSLVFVPLALRRVPRAQIQSVLRSDLGRASRAVLVSLIGYGLILEAFRHAPASYVVAVRQTSVLFAAWIGIAFLGERPDRARLAGAAATVAGVGLIGVGG